MKKYRDGKIRNCPICGKNITECKCNFQVLEDVCPICKEKRENCKCYYSEKTKNDPGI